VTAARTNRGERSRAAIVAAARRVFERDGFQNARISDISKLAGMAHGSFYTYFSSKEQVFEEVAKGLLVELMGADLPRAEDREDAVAGIEHANRAYLEAYVRDAALLRTWDEVATVDERLATLLRAAKGQFVARAERTLRNLQRAGRIDPALDRQYAAAALTQMVGGFAQTWLAGGDEYDLDAAVAQLTRLWINAIRLDDPPRHG
jgi:AcrR family transcriptional regulator